MVDEALTETRTVQIRVRDRG
ncbi:hypothetical protein [Streptosporangium sp. NBC_01756]